MATLFILACSNENSQSESGENKTTTSGEVKKVTKVGKMSDKDTSIPAHDWVVDILKSNADARSNQCILGDGKIVYFVNTCVSCPNQITEVFDGDTQEKLCEIGGESMVNTCSDELKEAVNQQGCQPVFLE